MMTAEQSSVPRYLITDPYPQSNINPFKVGDILELRGIHFTRVSNINTPPDEIVSPKSIHQNEIALYPNIFRELRFWQYRSFTELPKYLKLDLPGSKIGFVHKVEKYTGYNQHNMPMYEYYNNANYLSTTCIWLQDPATEEEYIKYKNKNL